jgi:co-chaperonin GroES (HSP10)
MSKSKACKSKTPGKVLGVRPAFSSILVEHLSPQEVMGGVLQLSETADVGTPQAYVLAIGPGLDQTKLGFEVGDRVIVQGNFVPMPKPEGQTRPLGVVEVHNIKAILEE